MSKYVEELARIIVRRAFSNMSVSARLPESECFDPRDNPQDGFAVNIATRNIISILDAALLKERERAAARAMQSVINAPWGEVNTSKLRSDIMADEDDQA